MKVLFSPIGHQDLKSDLRGSLGQIVQKYRPEKIILYFSAELVKYTNDVMQMIVLLKEEHNYSPEVDIVPDENMINPNSYQTIFPKFREHIRKLLIDLDGQDDEYQLILNAASGTPAMKSALIFISTLSNKNVIATQVDDPKYNKNEDRTYEVQTKYLVDEIQIQNIKTLVQKYDYYGAYEIVEGYSNKAGLDNVAVKYIRGAKFRSILDNQKGKDCFGGTDFKYDPQKGEGELSEYLNILQLKIKRSEFADFTRAISPALRETLYYLIDKLGVNRNEFSKLEPNKNTSKKSRILDVEKVKNNPRLRNIFRDVLEKPNKPYYYNAHLLNLLDEQDVDDRYYNKIKVVVNFESGVRNLAAHEIIKIDENRIIRDCGKSPQEILNIMAKLTNSELNLYDNINQEIIRLLG
ncbi:MAG: hypothetical protein LBI63_03820 [Candidatus Ancillula sp.]|nr:hypothetical protein [Candidatus Ancillula sp.]